VAGSFAAFAIWLWRFSSLLAKTSRAMREAALHGAATAMGSESWKEGNPHQAELAEELSIDAKSIVHSLRWPNAHVEIYSFQEVRRGTKGRTYYHYWIGYRFVESSFPKFDLKPVGVVPFIRRGWWRKVTLAGQVDFDSRFVLTGKDFAPIEQFFTPDRCAAILAVQWPRGASVKAGGNWLFAHREQLFIPSSETDSEASVMKEMQEVSSLVMGMLPIAEALSGSRLADASQRHMRVIPDASAKGRTWRHGFALLVSGTAVAGAILFAVIFLGSTWTRFDNAILKTEARRYVFAILFVGALCATSEWIIRSYRRTKQQAAAELEAKFSTSGC
jgi:hypothetical protein